MKRDYEIIDQNIGHGITIYPLSDVHYGALEHNEAGWSAICKEILSTENAYVVLGGDLINNATRSSISNIFEETVRPMEQKARMVEMLTPIRDRILCITSGNHEKRSIRDADDDPSYDIASKLDLEDVYRPNAAFVNIRVGDSKSQSVHVCVTHGAGGGIYTGATVNRNERFANIVEGLDLLIVGHTHKGTVTRPSKLVFNAHGGKVEQRELVVVSMVSWMEYGGYAMSKMLLPSSHSNPQKIVIPETKQHVKPRIGVIW